MPSLWGYEPSILLLWYLKSSDVETNLFYDKRLGDRSHQLRKLLKETANYVLPLHQRPHSLTFNDALKVFRMVDIKHDDRQIILLTERKGSHVHDVESKGYNLVEG